jgi:3-methyladenine DNA glycosylase Tag
MTTYCDYCKTHPEDTLYGFPIESDNKLFERLALEILLTC